MQLDARQRHTYLAQLKQKTFDLLVLGGGITGAGIALDAISRGLSVALLEMQDFGAGTSSRSTKLIHGGLRYLKQFEINLVREVGHERAVLFRNAPHIVIPEKMLLPITKTGSLGKFGTSIGLWVYEWLAGVKKEERRKMLNASQTLAAEPLLENEGLQGGGLYFEYRTDDARLVIEVLKTAISKGALGLNYVKVDSFEFEDGKAVGANCTDLLTSKSFQINAKTIINATGPWVDQLRKQETKELKKRLHPTKGVHLVVPFEKLPLRQALYFDTPDGRMIFAIPRDEITYIGTTDTTYKGPLDRPRTTQSDLEYILRAVNNMFTGTVLTPEDVISSWAGIRPLIHEKGKSPSELSRKDEIFISPGGVISIAGGKLTGFRKMAERAVDRAVQSLEKQFPDKKIGPCITEKIPLTGGEMPEGREAFRQKWAKIAEKEGWNPSPIDRLIRYYGSNIEQIKTLGSAESGEVNWLLGEVKYAVSREGARNLCDFLLRRSGRVYFAYPEIAKILDEVANYMATELNWTDSEKAEALADLHKEMQEVLDFHN